MTDVVVVIVVVVVWRGTGHAPCKRNGGPVSSTYEETIVSLP
jgi:hypothetical protein